MTARPTDGIVGTIAETVAGRTTYLVAPIPLAISDIRAGRLRALGVTTRKRSPLLPDVLSLADTGIAGFDYAIWYGVWAPAGTSDRVLDKLGLDKPVPGTAAELVRRVKRRMEFRAPRD